MSDETGSHAMDCYNDDNPAENDFDLNMCCKLEEKCWNGIDDDLDGKIDCADADCNADNPILPGTPQYCYDYAGSLNSSPFNTSGCIESYVNYGNGTVDVVWKDECAGQIPPNPGSPGYYYCGEVDPNTDPKGLAAGTPGVCCPVLEKPVWNSVQNRWTCEESAPCWDECGLDFDFNFTQWYEKVFHWVTPTDWCNSQVPELRNPDSPTVRSSACCLIAQAGTIGYYTDEDNVKIWG